MEISGWDRTSSGPCIAWQRKKQFWLLHGSRTEHGRAALGQGKEHSWGIGRVDRLAFVQICDRGFVESGVKGRLVCCACVCVFDVGVRVFPISSNR